MPYGAFPAKSGIYKIFFLNPELFYIGSSVNMRVRRKDHLVALRKGTHPNLHLQQAFSKYGEDATYFEVVEFVEQRDDLAIREQYYIDVLNPHYNINKVAVNAPVRKSPGTRIPWNKGKHNHLSQESKARLSESHKGQPSHMKGKKLTPEHVDRLVALHKGKPSWSKGKPQSEEHRRKNSEGHKGIPSWNKGRKLDGPSPRVGVPLSPESRASLIAKQRATWAAKDPEARQQAVEKRRATMAAKKAAKQASLWDDISTS